MPRRDAGRRGVALLEVLVAMAILGSAGLVLTAVLQQAARSQAELTATERRLDMADRVLAAMTLLTATELNQRLGIRTIGEFTTSVRRPEKGLYRLAIADAAHPDLTLLATVVYRPGEASQ